MTKTLLLSMDPIGAPAPGFVVSTYAFRPQSLTVSGTQETLRLLSGLKVPVHLAGAKAGFVISEHVELPAGVTFPTPGDAAVEVDVRITPITPGSAPLTPPATPPAVAGAAPTTPTTVPATPAPTRTSPP